MNLADVELLDAMIRDGMHAMSQTDMLRQLQLGSDPAYPAEEIDSRQPGEIRLHRGLSKRELLAAMAMQGLLSMAQGQINPAEQERRLGVDLVAKTAVGIADALLEELAK